MNNKDILQRFLFENIPIRGELVRLNHSFSTILNQHNYPPLLQQFLGEALIIVSLLSSIVKFKGRITLQFQGKGKLKLLLAQCNQDLHIRGLIDWKGDISEEELIDELKQGLLVIMMDPDASGQRYQGIVAWRGNTLAESIEGYFETSEQLLTRIWVFVEGDNASGMLLQVMPGTRSQNYENPLTPTLDWENMVILTDTIKPEELLFLDNKTLLHRLYVEEDVRLFEPTPVIFRCTCSTKRGETAIVLLGRDEVEEELAEKQKLIVTCEFCNKEYEYDRVDVERIFRQGGMPPSTQIH